MKSWRYLDEEDLLLVYLALWGAILFLAGCAVGTVVVWVL